jgi:predicted transposase YbfD/YdcC
MAAWGHN